MELTISDALVIPDHELEWTAIRAQGAGGQNVNKVASAVHLRFNSQESSALPSEVKARLLQMSDRRISREGVIVIKAQRSRSQEKNRDDALLRLKTLLQKALARPKPRKPTRPSRRARQQRVDDKVHRGRLKQQRSRIDD